MGAIGKPKREIFIPVPEAPAVPEVVPLPEPAEPEPVRQGAPPGNRP